MAGSGILEKRSHLYAKLYAWVWQVGNLPPVCSIVVLVVQYGFESCHVLVHGRVFLPAQEQHGDMIIGRSFCLALDEHGGVLEMSGEGLEILSRRERRVVGGIMMVLLELDLGGWVFRLGVSYKGELVALDVIGM